MSWKALREFPIAITKLHKNSSTAVKGKWSPWKKVRNYEELSVEEILWEGGIFDELLGFDLEL